MDRVLLRITRKKERRQLEDWLSKSYHIVLPNAEHSLEEQFDLAIIDGKSLKQLRPGVRARRQAEEPVFLRFLLLTARRRGSMPARHLGRVVDDVMSRTISEKALKARGCDLRSIP